MTTDEPRGKIHADIADGKIRSDDLASVQQQLCEAFRAKQASMYGGWLNPVAAYAFYSQNGVIRSLGLKLATLMSKSDWSYTDADVADFNWSPTQSRLETLRIKAKLQQSVLWWYIFGGGAIERIVDVRGVEDGQADRSQPLKNDDIRRVRKLVAWSAFDLEPETGHTYLTSPTFRLRDFSDGTRIHRSRLSIVVGNDVPPGLGRWGSRGFINTYTGWPPSPLEGLYRSHLDWRNAENDASTMLHVMSIVHIALEGYRKARNGVSEDEQAAVTAMLQDIVDNLTAEGILFTDTNDKATAIDRSITGLKDLIESKRLTFLSDSGFTEEMVLGTAAGNLGENSGGRRDRNTMIDGLRQVMLTPVIEDVTDSINAERRYLASIPPEAETLEIPTEYVTQWGPIDEQTGPELAKQRRDEAAARKDDAQTGVPAEVIATDPALARNYTGYNAWIEEQEERRRTAAEVEAEGPKIPDGSLESASAVAEKLGISPATLLSMRAQGRIEGFKVGSRWRFHFPTVYAAIKGEAVEDAARTRVDGSTLGLSDSDHFGECWGASVAMLEIFAVLERVAPSDLPVLITGETGTGKELVARGLHRGYGRGEFMAINCAVLTDPKAVIAEVELLASSDGTLFLDELGELGPESQAAMLRVLAEAKARIVGATWRDVHDSDQFRIDLLNRVAGVEVEIPPLREREDDVLELARRFLIGAASDAGVDPPSPLFDPSAERALMMHQWPGNVRELSNVIRRAALFSALRRPIEAGDLGLGR